MTTADRPRERYEFRLAERLTPALRHAFADCVVRDEDDASRIVATVESPEALDRIMERFARIGLRVVELRRLGT